jgi:glucose/arabinose dehydrogenase
MNITLKLILLLFALNIYGCTKESKQQLQQENKQQNPPKNSNSTVSEILVFCENLEVPWSIVFTSPERMLVNERPGRLRIVENGKLIDKPLKVFPEVSSGSEEGLMGLAIDPDYTNNKLIYVSYAYEKGGDLVVKVVRFKDNGDNLSEETVIIDGLPAARFHAGCRIRFGPDNKLYITTGDAGERKLAQGLDNLYGKILRINADGTIPSDNPFANSPIWSYGHRNPQGIDWHASGTMWSTEHGPSGFDGPGGGDEVNVIIKGGNYGWPEVSHEDSKEGMISPLLVFTPADAPASGMFYQSGKIEEFKNTFLFGCLRGQGIIVVKVKEGDPTKFDSFKKIATDYGRIRDIAEGPDGSIYFSSSNKDGRGNLKKGDDKIYRIMPESK